MAERGKYQTRQKEVIADYFRGRPDACMTAEEVYSALGADVGMTTVYRAVSRLCEENFLRRYAPQNAGDAALYQLNPCRESHLHIRCVDCGTLAHLRCDVVRDFTQHLLGHHGFVLDESQTVLYGRCEKCEANRQKQNEADSAVAANGSSDGSAANADAKPR
ncbi:MAG TPA: transcriptional repressor [Candidatus Limiplasma sp.]|nr:transcriptional repressor [Candidatus Limiplasma sp.]HPS82602.1 transcriptional repressor [Candidatus Limiplasma sp.]